MVLKKMEIERVRIWPCGGDNASRARCNLAGDGTD